MVVGIGRGDSPLGQRTSGKAERPDTAPPHRRTVAKIEKQASLCMLKMLAVTYDGCIDINSDTIRRAIIDDDIVKLELTDGTVALASDMDADTLLAAVRKWIIDNSKQDADA